MSNNEISWLEDRKERLLHDIKEVENKLAAAINRSAEDVEYGKSIEDRFFINTAQQQVIETGKYLPSRNTITTKATYMQYDSDGDFATFAVSDYELSFFRKQCKPIDEETYRSIVKRMDEIGVDKRTAIANATKKVDEALAELFRM